MVVNWREIDADGAFQDVPVEESYVGTAGPFAVDSDAAYTPTNYEGTAPDIYDSYSTDTGAVDETDDPTLQDGFRSTRNMLVDQDPTRANNVLRFANFKGLLTPISVANLDDPSAELATLNYTGQGNFLFVRSTVSGIDEGVIYFWDAAIASGADVPYIVAGSGGYWVALTGKNMQGNRFIKGNLTITGAAAAATVNTGQGANELYPMDQSMLSSASPTFVTETLSGLTATRLVKTDGSKALASQGLGTALQALRTNAGATDVEWATPTTGTVTSVALTAPAVFSVAGSPITSSGSLDITWAAATSGKILQTNGTNFVASSATWPTAATTGKIIFGNGTNYVESTPTFPNTAAGIGTILRADGSNWLASAATYPNTISSTNVLFATAVDAIGADTSFTYSVAAGLGLNNAAVFNESGADKDFRIEGDTNVNLFFSDASTDRVGIGTSTPASTLDVNGVIRSSGFSSGLYVGSFFNVSGAGAVTAASFSSTVGAISTGGSISATGPSSTVTGGGGLISSGGPLTLGELFITPSTPTANGQTKIYVKGDKLVFFYNAGGTPRYWYLDMTSAATQSLTYTGTAP
jgi:hypothetical protein